MNINLVNIKNTIIRTPQGKLFLTSALFLLLISISITVSPAAQARSFNIDFIWNHWLGFLTWLILFSLMFFVMKKNQVKLDLLLLPITALISGWGLITIWRISPSLGLKQTIWFGLGMGLLVFGTRYGSRILQILRDHKYLWIFFGLAITTLTLIVGINPNGQGPELWLGCCGFYFQPSEPLKLLLILYMASYFADRQPFTKNLPPLLTPTMIMATIAFIILVVQKDLGTTFIFVVIYSSMIYMATGKKRLLGISILIIFSATFLGYYLFDVVQLRFEAWINPWIDPSGRSYQIVQSLIAIASGGLTGRGPGMGYPELVPISFSDFIYSSIAEEYGFPGSLGLVIALLIFTFRGLQIGLKADNRYHSYLAIGLSTFLASQSILIMGGNIRLVPLTGVTLPFVSYGGSSLLTSFFALLLLISINQHSEETDPPIRNHDQTFHIAAFLIAGFASIAIITSWWSFWRGPDLVTRLDNARRSISDRYVKRGDLLDRNFNRLSYSQGKSGYYERVYEYAEFSPLIGYTQPFFSQAGLEFYLDPILRGLENQSPWKIWLNHLLYGQAPEGFDVQLSLDKELQLLASDLLPRTSGAIVLINSNSGEILVMYSAPFYDANTLTENWDALQANPESPFINRAIQSLYPPGPSIAPFLLTETSSSGVLPDEIKRLKSPLDTIDLRCANPISLPSTWEETVKAGCPGPLEQLGNQLGADGIMSLFKRVGFYETPKLRASLTSAPTPSSITNPAVAAIGQKDIQLSPMQLVLAAAVFSNDGARPYPQLLLSAENYRGEWTNYTESDQSVRVFSASSARQTAELLAHPSIPIWETTAIAVTDLDRQLTWYLAGTLPDQAQKLTVVVLIERFEPELAARIGQTLILEAIESSN